MLGAVAAADAPPPTRAVDAVNGHFEALGGSYATHGFYGGIGSLTVPVGNQFGLQLDAGAGSYANRFLAAGGGHLFWRDPRAGLLGLYGDHQHWGNYGGVHVSHVGAEGEAYLGRWTVHGVVGAEFGNNNAATTTTSSSRVIVIGPGTFTTTVVSSGLVDKTRVFDRLSLSYYITDDWKASVGHRYVNGRHLLALGTEYAVPTGHGTMASFFAEGRLGEGSNNYGAWGGARLYFGPSDKSLIRRHREDDPSSDFAPDSLFSIANSLGPSSTTSKAVCPFGEVFINGSCI